MSRTVFTLTSSTTRKMSTASPTYQESRREGSIASRSLLARLHVRYAPCDNCFQARLHRELGSLPRSLRGRHRVHKWRGHCVVPCFSSYKSRVSRHGRVITDALDYWAPRVPWTPRAGTAVFFGICGVAARIWPWRTWPALRPYTFENPVADTRSTRRPGMDSTLIFLEQRS